MHELDEALIRHFKRQSKDIKNKETDVFEAYNELLNLENVEIYTIICDDITETTEIDKVSVHQTRSYRFNALLDDSVNINISREADGIVTFTDCHNIRCFEKSNNNAKIIDQDYLPKYVPDADFYIFISTIDPRKNQKILFDSWKLLMQKSITNIHQLLSTILPC